MKKNSAVEWLEQEFLKLERTIGVHGQIYELLEQAKEMEKEQKYSIDFIMWYSGMDKEKIERSHKRWNNETFKSE
jgi:hypothetical protein